VLAADVLEHVREPEQLLAQIRDVLVPGGTLLVSVPNFGHWYARGRTALGLFDYDQRGVLDRGHVRFFTRRSLRRRLRAAGFVVAREEATGLPLDVLASGQSGFRRAIAAIDRLAVAARPTLFGYQFVCMCELPPEPPAREQPARG
jgi:SAM-dependent methyltransferase